MTAKSWFGYVAMGASSPYEARVMDQLEAVLERLQPAQVDPEQSSAVDGTFTIAHREDPSANVVVTVDEHCATIQGLGAPEEIPRWDGMDVRAWAAEVADVVAALLRDRYEVVATRVGRRLIRTRVTSESVVQVRVHSTLALVPIPGRLLRRSVSVITYGVIDSRRGT